MVNKVRLVVFGWLVGVLALFLYSFTQIDLGLTLTRASFWQPIQRLFQRIGYFQRPLSVLLYFFILAALFFFYSLILKAIKKKQLELRQIWLLIFVTATLLWFTYNAFSYDLFNYMFDAKVVAFYGKNPYEHRALDFPEDPMLGFMHWTHRLYPYGPAWLAFTIPLSFLGFQKLLPTALLIKGLAVGAYLLSCYWLSRILGKTDPENRLWGLSLFAFSPFVLIEGLVSGHNDILMMALALGGFWFLVKGKPAAAYGLLFLSVGVKFATALLLPVFLVVSFYQQKGKKINWEKVWSASFLLMAVAVLVAVKRDELKPWYLFYPFSFLGLLSRKKWLVLAATFLSFGLLLHYAPFLYLGNWDPPVPAIKNSLTLGFLALGAILGYWLSLKSKSSGQKLPG